PTRRSSDLELTFINHDIREVNSYSNSLYRLLRPALQSHRLVSLRVNTIFEVGERLFSNRLTLIFFIAIKHHFSIFLLLGAKVYNHRHISHQSFTILKLSSFNNVLI